jgi:hypothetical protein
LHQSKLTVLGTGKVGAKLAMQASSQAARQASPSPYAPQCPQPLTQPPTCWAIVSSASRLLSSRSATAAAASSPLLAPPETSSSCSAMRAASAACGLGAGAGAGSAGAAALGELLRERPALCVGVAAPPADARLGLPPSDADPAPPYAAPPATLAASTAATAAATLEAPPATPVPCCSTACRRRTSCDCSFCSWSVVWRNSFSVWDRPAAGEFGTLISSAGRQVAVDGLSREHSFLAIAATS